MNSRDILQNPDLAWSQQNDGDWNWKLAAHLHRRAGFGGTRKQIARSVKDGMKRSIDQLLSQDSASSFDKEMAPIERVFVNGDPRGLSAWWLLRMLRSPCPLQEKMTLFWHGHFATSAGKVQFTRAMYDQNHLLRKFALGKFEPMVQAISRDVAMLIYLDSTDNRKTRPNENYARELMELFCLGPGNYTEDDIKQVARSFTGWEVHKRKFRFNPYQHDKGEKKVFDSVGKFDGNDAVRLVIQQKACGLFIARKLIRFFVADEVDISNELAEPLASTLRENEFDVSIALRKIFNSRLFYSGASVGRKVKSPVELIIGVMRYLDASTNMEQIANRLEELGQLPLYPPNVKGWDGGRKWINASTILGRANLVTDLVANGKTKIRDGNLSAWWNNQNFDSPVKDLAADLLPTDLNEQVGRQIADMVGKSKQPDNQDIIKTLSSFAVLPEFQLN